MSRHCPRGCFGYTFVSSHLAPDDQYCVFDLLGRRFGTLICYDNNLVENVRITTPVQDRLRLL